MAVLKADGYGHGAEPLAQIAGEGNIDFIGVSSLEEGITLRTAGIRLPILNLGGIYPLENFSVAFEHNLIPTVASFEAARTLLKIAESRNTQASFHLKVDTGMGRIGVSVEEAKKILSWTKNNPSALASGVYSHFSCADSDSRFSQTQLKKFDELRKFAKTLSLPPIQFHMANSAALFRFKNSHMDIVRPGLAMYGDSLVALPKGVKLFPVLSWHSRIIFLKKVKKGTSISYGQTYITKKESRIATVPVGYADGIPRAVSNKAFVLIGGKRCPLVGRVTMDQVMADVTGVNAKVGDEVIMVGSQGKKEIKISEWARWAGTISYEIFCGISKRVPRVYR